MVIIISANIIVVIIGVPIVESTFTSVDNHKVGRTDLSFLKVLIMLNIDVYFISSILLPTLF